MVTSGSLMATTFTSFSINILKSIFVVRLNPLMPIFVISPKNYKIEGVALFEVATTDNKHEVDWICPDKTGKWRREPANIKIVQTKNVLTRNKDVTEVKGRKRFSFYFFIAVF